MRFIRFLIAVLILFILIAVLVVGSLLYFIDPNKIKPIVVKEVEKRSGYLVNIDSHLSWSFYPRMSVVIPKMSIKAPQDNQPFLTLHNVKIATQISSLWQQNQRLLGNIVADQAILGRVKISAVKANLSWQQNAITLAILQSNFYEGSLTASVTAANLTGQPTWTWQVKANRFSAQACTRDLAGEHAKIQLAGLTDAAFTGTAHGKNRSTIIKSMLGDLSLSINQGAILGVDINYLLQTAQALIHKKPIASVNTGQTDFDSLSGNAKISDGFLRSDNLHLVASNFSANAKGALELLNNDIQLKLSVLPTSLDERLVVPIVVYGTVAQPKVALDMDEISKILAKSELEKVKDKVEQQIDKHVPDDVGGFIKNLIGR